jgi:predicted RNA-binding Zn ribbon-like protein
VTGSAAPALELVRDFVNTLDVESGVDSLDSDWLATHGLADAGVQDALDVREAIRELLLANNGLAADVERAAATLDRAALASRAALRFVDGSASVEGEGLVPILAALAEAMQSDDWTRLKACRAETCHWAFVDHAKNRSRAWCAMSVCGNRQKAQRYRRRHARGTQPAPAGG